MAVMLINKPKPKCKLPESKSFNGNYPKGKMRYLESQGEANWISIRANSIANTLPKRHDWLLAFVFRKILKIIINPNFEEEVYSHYIFHMLTARI